MSLKEGRIFSLKQGNRGTAVMISDEQSITLGLLISRDVKFMNGKPGEARTVDAETAIAILEANVGTQVAAEYASIHIGDADSLSNDLFLTSLSFVQPEVFADIVTQFHLSTE